jgi:hypothetical protein
MALDDNEESRGLRMRMDVCAWNGTSVAKDLSFAQIIWERPGQHWTGMST